MLEPRDIDLIINLLKAEYFSIKKEINKSEKVDNDLIEYFEDIKRILKGFGIIL